MKVRWFHLIPLADPIEFHGLWAVHLRCQPQITLSAFRSLKRMKKTGQLGKNAGEGRSCTKAPFLSELEWQVSNTLMDLDDWVQHVLSSQSTVPSAGAVVQSRSLPAPNKPNILGVGHNGEEEPVYRHLGEGRRRPPANHGQGDPEAEVPNILSSGKWQVDQSRHGIFSGNTLY